MKQIRVGEDVSRALIEMESSAGRLPGIPRDGADNFPENNMPSMGSFKRCMEQMSRLAELHKRLVTADIRKTQAAVESMRELDRQIASGIRKGN